MPVRRTLIKTRISVDIPWAIPTEEWINYRKINYIDTGKILSIVTTCYNEYGDICIDIDASKTIKTIVTFLDMQIFEAYRLDKNKHQLSWAKNEIVEFMVEQINYAVVIQDLKCQLKEQ